MEAKEERPILINLQLEERQLEEEVMEAEEEDRLDEVFSLYYEVLLEYELEEEELEREGKV